MKPVQNLSLWVLIASFSLTPLSSFGAGENTSTDDVLFEKSNCTIKDDCGVKFWGLLGANILDAGVYLLSDQALRMTNKALRESPTIGGKILEINTRKINTEALILADERQAAIDKLQA